MSSANGTIASRILTLGYISGLLRISMPLESLLGGSGDFRSMPVLPSSYHPHYEFTKSPDPPR